MTKHDRHDLAPADAAPGDVDLPTLIDAELAELVDLLPLLDDLADTHQRGLGFLTVTGRRIMDEQIRKERAARSSGRHLPAGQAFLRPATITAASGERPVPGNLAAISLAAEIHWRLTDATRSIRRRLTAIGVCHIQRPVLEPTTAQLIDETRTLVALLRHRPTLLTLHGDVEDLRIRVHATVHGNDRAEHPKPCPHCGRHTLVVYFRDQDIHVIRCERDPHTGEFEPCICDDSYCDCKVRHHRHEWRRDIPASKKWSVQSLARDQARNDRTRAQHTEGAQS